MTLSPSASNRYSVRVDRGDRGWSVRILGPGGAVEFVRACPDETDARTFASTVQQHIYWLSEPKFREYYRLAGEA